MRSFLTAAAFALVLTFSIVLLAVALWNETTGRRPNPQPVQYTGTAPTLEPQTKQGLLPGQGPNDRILVVPSQ